MKTCSKCKTEKLYSAFSKCRSNADGYMYYCKQCYNIYVKVWNANVVKKTKNNWLYNTDKGAATRHKNKRIYRERRRNRRRSTDGYTLSEWNEIKTFYGCCVCCGKTTDISADHVIPAAIGGKDSADNIQPLCRPCNSLKSAQHIDFRLFWMVFVKYYPFQI